MNCACSCGKESIDGPGIVRGRDGLMHSGLRCQRRPPPPWLPEDPETARLRRRVETLEGRLARVLNFADATGLNVKWSRLGYWTEARRGHGRVWSGRRAGEGR